MSTETVHDCDDVEAQRARWNKPVSEPALNISPAANNDGVGAGGDVDPLDWNVYMKVPELKAVIAARNEGRDDEDLIEPESNRKDDLVAALQEDDGE